MTATITINGTLILINFIIGFLLGRKLASVKDDNRKAKKSESHELPTYDELFINPIDAIKEFEPIKTHVAEFNKARSTCEALNKAIRTNLRDNGYVVRSHKFLPDLTELQNIIRLKPIIKDLEDQYKRFEEASAIKEVESKWIADILRRVMSRVMDDPDMKKLVSERGIDKSEHHNRDLYELLRSPEAEGIIDRCISELMMVSNND